MISIILTLHNRAHLLKWCLEAIREAMPPWYMTKAEICILDDGSTDNLDDLLLENSRYFGSVKKWMWDRSKSVNNITFNCPAEPYNILVKLASNSIIFKTDPEMVLLDNSFIERALHILDHNSNAIVIPFPYHCYEFPIESLEDIRKNYLSHHYPTHITKENAPYEMIYYQAAFHKKSYLDLGGVDERFSESIGSEDNHFLDSWKKVYGQSNFITLTESPTVHLWHGEWGKGVPSHLYGWVNKGAELRQQLKDTRPNEGREWGRTYDHITLTEWRAGNIWSYRTPIGELNRQ